MSLRNLLNKLKKDDELVSIATFTSNASKSYVGYIHLIGKGEVSINLVNQVGKHDGFSIIDLDVVYNISYKSIYLNKIKLLVDQKPEVDSIYEKTIWDTLSEAKDKKVLISAHLADDYSLIGYVIDKYDDKELDSIWVEIEEYDEYGRKVGNELVRYSDIRQLIIGGEYLSSIERMIVSG